MENLVITLNLNVNQVDTILAALAKAPYELVRDLIATVQTQGMEQVNAHKQSAEYVSKPAESTE